jgi:S1-C subfamily serine protease
MNSNRIVLKSGFTSWVWLAMLATAVTTVRLAALEETDPRQDATVKAIERALPSVVSIATVRERAADPMEDAFRRTLGLAPLPTERREEPLYIGSGVIIDDEGYIITNFHVVEGASRVQVKLADGRIYNAARLVARPGSDIALLKISAKAGEPPFKAIRFAKDDDLLLGEAVVALGNPFGLGVSVSRGILSSKNRRAEAGNEPLSVNDWLQTDAAINPGNSGGPLIDLRGEMIGINARTYREAQGMGVAFAIPVKQISASLSGFFTPEWTDSLWFGAKFRAGPYPLSIIEVQPGSPADKAGLRVGQEIVQVNGKTPVKLIECAALVATSPDNEATFEVREGEKLRSLKVRMIPFEDLVRQKLGLTLLQLTPETAASFGISTASGLFAKEIEKGSPADLPQLRNGFLLTELDNEKMVELGAAVRVLTSKKSGDTVRAVVAVPQFVNRQFAGFQQGALELKLR